MIQDHNSLKSGPTAARAYRCPTTERVRRFMPMVRRLAWHVHGSGRVGIELEDLMQAGLVALTEAAQRPVGPGEDGFAAYAKIRVRGAMVDLVRRAVPISRGGIERRRQLAGQEKVLRGQLGRDPTAAELAEGLGISANELAQLRGSSEPLRFEPMDAVYSDHDPAFADDRPDSHDILATQELRVALADALASLPERLQLVMQLYFVEELNLAEIAATLDVSVPRIHQLKAQALERLRAGLGGLADIV
jgi:RNA polymerase sigma factor for flagellar operon FliA